jgi:hypothetical protein
MMITNGRRSLSFAAISIVCLAMWMNQAYAAPTTTTMTGELVETYCWAVHQVGGPAHAHCGIECAKRGLPVAIVDPQSRKAVVLLAGRDKTSLPAALIEAMGHQVTVHGELVVRGGVPFLAVQSWERVR